MADRRAGPRAKIERAKKHIADLEVELRAFFASNPYVVHTKRNPETRQLIYYVSSVQETPSSFALITGDAIQSLRTALDHLAYQLVIIGTGRPGPFRHVYFPIADSAEEYETKKRRQIKGMGQEAIKAVDAVKPYKGGNDQLWLVHGLNNIDKHRLLITVGSGFQSFDLGAYMFRDMQQLTARDGWPTGLSEMPGEMHWFVRPADTMCPLKAGDELLIDGPDAEVNDKLQFRFDVAFSEPEIGESKPLLDTLVEIADVVENLVESFGPLLA